MHSPSILFMFFFIITILVTFSLECEARDIINVRNPLNGTTFDTLVSASNRFELGFFTPQINNDQYYIGIWCYNLVPRTIVWVANRDKPLPISSCDLFGIDAVDGNLKIWCKNGDIHYPITNLIQTSNSNRTLQLLDNGNLILYQSGTRVWQSFDYPTDTFLPGMKMSDNMELVSWISPNNPGTGNYTFRRDQGVYAVQKRSSFYWKSSEPGAFSMYDELPSVVGQMFSGSDEGLSFQSLANTRNKNYISYGNFTQVTFIDNSRLVMNSSGEVQLYYYDPRLGKWSLWWSEPHDPCSVYEACGKFSICNVKNEPMCQCLSGFRPVSLGDWKIGKYSDGCERESILCGSDQTKIEYVFLNLSLMKVAGQVIEFDRAQKEADCKEECLDNCKCEAYSFKDTGINISDRETGSVTSVAAECRIWTSDLENLNQDESTDGRLNLSLRVPVSAIEPTCDSSLDCKDLPDSNCLDKGDGRKRCYCNKSYNWDDTIANCTAQAIANLGNASETSKKKSRIRYVIVCTVLAAGVVLVLCASYILYRRRRMDIGTGNRGSTETSSVLFSYESGGQESNMIHENDKGIDVPFYNLDTILSATENFSDANKLGRGGFGPVYKGTFPGGREIAVKRLSSCSSQGIDEFLNEVTLIAKLQHRNLVRLLGYCIKENEKILLYEYMPNRSLDSFIFDQNKCMLLDWKKRFDIILGIARGLLYLHQDSRLRIVHRDLKTSNILLDEEMNPKISDFGLARIVEGKGTEASTNKVVGTYGYMSPEYALEGKFSIKSDVFSFGVVILEIISGKKNTGFYHPQEVLTLLGYTWRLWSENKTLDLIDPTIKESCDKSQVMKFINIGLLCVQEDPNDRPSMTNVVLMLGTQTSSPLSAPNQPAFVVRRRLSSTSSSSSTKPNMISNNDMTISMEQGR